MSTIENDNEIEAESTTSGEQGITSRNSTGEQTSPSAKPSKIKSNPNNKLQHIPKFSSHHPMIPRRYVHGWKTDMENRKQLLAHANDSDIQFGPHDESMYLRGRERLNQGEKRCCVERKIDPPDQFYLLHPLFYHHLSKYQSGLMYRHERKLEQCQCHKD